LLAICSGRPHVAVTVVDTGDEALRAVRLQCFDCVVINHPLPDYNVDDWLRKATADPKSCPVLVIGAPADDRNIDPASTVIHHISSEQAVVPDALWTLIDSAVVAHRQHANNRRRAERRVRFHMTDSDRDDLSGAFSRQYFLAELNTDRWKHDRRRCIACTLFCIDHLGVLTRRYGLQVRNKVIRDVAHVLRQVTNTADVVAGWTRDALLVVKSFPTCDQAELWAERVRRAIELRDIHFRRKVLHTTVSVGVAHTLAAKLSEHAIEQADKAVRLAQMAGHNSICRSDMLDVAQTICRIAAQTNVSAEYRFNQLLRELGTQVDTTQYEHITRHAQEVSDLAVRLADLLDLPARRTEALRLAGLIHDIGKCMVSESLLAKPAPLSLEEARLVARHTQFGMWIAGQLGFDAAVTQLVARQHQRYTDPDDPTTGVLPVADALATMVSHRAYRPARTMREALAELRREREHQFAPEVVDAAHLIEFPAERPAA
jgi:diguanylate cyclase (GGDEF)-like protein/putative nucleotidyltransferase with HDIG domain